MSRRKHKRSQEEVELNLAAMLDMAFQLLTFFILTFKPTPIEGEISLNLPPPAAMTNVAAANPSDGPSEEDLIEEPKETLLITLRADGRGNVSAASVGENVAFRGPASAGNLKSLDARLKEILAAGTTPFEQVLIQVDPGLSYDELMKVIDVASSQKFADGTPLTKLSFAELPLGS